MKPQLALLAAIAALSATASGPAYAAKPTKEAAVSSPNDADDCAIFVALGIKLLGWGKTKPDKTQFPIFYRPEGAGYVEQCPWRNLGIEPLPMGAPDMSNIHYFTAPEYGAGRRRADVSFGVSLTSPEGYRFVAQTDCTLTKRGRRWSVSRCRAGAIT